MVRYVPPFILQHYGQGELQGSLRACVLYFDIIDFTHIADTLRKQGNKGAEGISRLLDSVLEMPLAWVNDQGGFVTSFAGDAFWAVFPQDDPSCALETAILIRNHFRLHKGFGTSRGRINVKVRQGLGFGQVDWRVFPNPMQNEYVFKGSVFDELERLSEKHDELVLTPALMETLMAQGLADKSGNISSGFQPGKIPAARVEYPHDPSLALEFTHPRFHKLKPGNEIRNVISNFSIVKVKDPAKLDEMIASMQLLVSTAGGYVNKISLSGDLYKSLVFYGIPRNEGITLDRIAKMAFEAWKEYPELKHGATIGRLFTGHIGNSEVSEYTAIGHGANLAARLAEMADFGEVLLDRAAKDELAKSFSFAYQGRHKLRGVSGTAPVYRLAGMNASGPDGRQAAFVGRKAELTRINRHIGNALEHHDNCVVYVSGEPGIGKTRLLDEAMSLNSAGGWQCFDVFCDPLNTHPLEPLKQLFATLFGLNQRQSGQDAADSFSRNFCEFARDNENLLGQMSFIGALFGYAWEGSLREMAPAELRQQRGFEAGLAVFRELCSRKPLLVRIEDLHWMDGQTREFLQFLGRSDIKGLCLLVSTRYREDGSLPGLDLQNFKAVNVDLRPLGIAATIELHKELLDVTQLPKATIDLIRQRSTGNPFLIEQVVSYYVEQGRVNSRGEVKNPFRELSSTYSTEEIIGHRIDRLPDRTRDCVYNASVLGLRFNVKVLSLMMGYDPNEELDNGAHNRIWKKVDVDCHAFSHILIQNAAYQRMMTERLHELHLRAASSMADLFGSLPNEHSEEIAGHYERAGALTEAAEHFDLAMENYWENSYFEMSEAASLKAIALGAKAYGKASMQYGEKVFHLALLYHYLLRYEEAEPLYLEVVRIAGKTHGLRNPLMSPYLNNLGRFYKDIGRYPESETYLRRSLGFERKISPNTSNEADRINNIGHLYIKQGLWDKAEKMMLKAYEIMDKNHDPDHWFMAAVCNNLGGVYLEQGKLDLSEQLLQRAVTISENARGKEHPVTAIYLKNLGNTYMKKGLLKEAERLYLRSLDIYSRSFGRMHQNTLIVVESLKQLYGITQNKELQKRYSDWLKTKP